MCAGKGGDGGWGSRPGCSKHRSGPTGTKTLEIKEWYQNREDMLELKHINKSTGLNIDYFKPGHPQALRGEWTPLPVQRGAQDVASNRNRPSCLSKSDVWEVRGSAENPGKCDKCPSRKVKNQGHMPILWLGLGTQ